MADANDGADLTQLLQAALDGNQDAESQFCRAVYDELHRHAQRLVSPSSSHATTIVHEVYLKLFRRHGLKKAPSRQYFYKVAIDQMRKLLIDYHRKRRRLKAGGHLQQVPLDQAMDQVLDDFEHRNGCDVEAMEAALVRLRETSERQYQVVIHRFYGGCSVEETAKALDVSKSSVELDWRLARAKLLSYLKSDDSQEHRLG